MMPLFLLNYIQITVTAEVTQAIKMEESQCVDEKDYSESTDTEQQNSQNEPNYKIAEFYIKW